MKEVRIYLAFCMVLALLFGACGTAQTGEEPTSAPEVTKAPEVTAPAEDTKKVTEAIAPTEKAPEVTEEPQPTETPTVTEELKITEAPAATEAPVATEPPKATEVPMATELPKATEAPKPTATPKSTVTPKPTATPEPTATPTPVLPKASVENGDITYRMDELKLITNYDVEYEVQRDGSANAAFTTQYAHARFALPEAIDADYCTGLTIKMKVPSPSIWMGISFYREGVISNPYSESEESDIVFVQIKDVVEEHGIPVSDVGDIYAIGLLSTGGWMETADSLNLVMESITFHMLSGNPVGVPKEIAPDVTEDMTLLNTYGTVFGKIGTCATLEELRNPAVLHELKKQYNSITNAMGVGIDSVVSTTEFLSVEEAKRMGYAIPPNYKESVVPKLKFDEVDEFLKICSENGLYCQFNVLLWYGYENEHFFRQGYKVNGEYVTPEVMDARMEFYIRTVMEHVHKGKYGQNVYVWGVMNEHFHQTEDTSVWMKIYGEPRLTPAYLKHFYEVADETLRDCGVRNKVSLMINEFDTYTSFNGRSLHQDMLALLEYINSDGMLCDTIGMQSHLDTNVPIMERQKETIEAFVDAGYSIQITEAEVNIKDFSTGIEDQERYYCEFMKTLLEIARDGGKINGLTFWGAGDTVSWLKEHTPLMFSHIGRPKDVYYKVLQTYANPDSVELPQPEKITFSGDELQYLVSWNVTNKTNSDGSMDVCFGQQYTDIKMLLPETVDLNKCAYMTVKIKSEYASVAVKIFGEEIKDNPNCSEIFIHWECLGDGVLNYDVYPKMNDEAHGIGLMSMEAVDDFSKYKATLYSVTFYMKPGDQAE